MSPKNFWLRIVKQMVLTLAAALTFWAGTVHADAPYTWKGAVTGGTWSTDATNWKEATGTPWDDTCGTSNIANFNTASLNATVSDTVYTNGIIFSAAGTLSGGTINLVGTTPTITANANGTISSQISGIAGLIKTGTGTLTLTASQSYSGPTTITSGTLKYQPASWGLGVQFRGGGYGNPGPAIGVNDTAGVFPMSHWNSFAGNISTSASLNDSSGNTVGAVLTSFTAPDVYYTDSKNPLLKGYLDNTCAGGIENVTISNIPYSSYDVYAYFGSNDPGRTGSVRLDPISGLSVKYYYTTRGVVDDYLQTQTSDESATYPSANYAVWSGVHGTSFTVNQYRGSNSSGLHGIEIVNTTPIFVPATNFLPTITALSIDANATLDLSGGSQQVASLSDSSLGGGSIINSNTGTTAVLTLSPTGGSTTFSGGILSGGSNGTISLVKTGDGTQVLAGSNTYTGGTTISGGVLRVGVLANGGSASGIGASDANPANLLLSGGTLKYTGATASTDRCFMLGTGTSGIDASGTGLLSLTGGTLGHEVAYSGTGARTLVLTGSNTNKNTFSLILDDGAGGATSLWKEGIGSWTLSGTNHYTGGTTVAAGTLFVTSNTAILEGTSLTIGAGGVLLFAPPASGGSLMVGRIQEAISVPEPGTLALLIAGLAVGFGLWRRRQGG